MTSQASEATTRVVYHMTSQASEATTRLFIMQIYLNICSTLSAFVSLSY